MSLVVNGWPAGTGIFETMRVEDGKIFALHRHHCRAIESAKLEGFTIPSEEFVNQESYKVVAENEHQLARLRWHFAAGDKFSISYEPYEDPKKPARLMILENSVDLDFSGVQIKRYPYRNLKLLEVARTNGFDDGILINPAGQIAESAIATLLLKVNGEWVTPPLSSGILNGVVRALTIEAGLAKVRSISAVEIPQIESALLLTSLRISQLVGEISGQILDLDEQKHQQIHQLMNQYKGL